MEFEADTARGRYSLVATNLIHLVRSAERLCVSFNEGMRVSPWGEELERFVAKAPPLVSHCKQGARGPCRIGLGLML